MIRRRYLRSGIALVLSLTVGCSGSCNGRQQSASVTRSAATSAAPVKTELDAALARYPEDEFDPDAKSKKLGPDIARIFAFVRDDIRYEAYSGVLRGAHGALSARAANSHDRSLLLARLLSRNGIQVRYAVGELSAESVQLLFTRVFDVTPGTELQADSTKNTFLDRLVSRAKRDYPVLQAAIGTSSPRGAQQAREQALADIRRHVWVQANVNDEWQDLDSAFADAKPGTKYCAPKQVVNELPDAWHQKVVVRVTSEHLREKKLVTATALTVADTAVNLIDLPVFLSHVPAKKGAGGLGLSIGAAASGTDDWTPVLLAGSRSYKGESISFGSDGGGGLADAFGGGGDDSGFVGEWLELEITTPDGRRDVSRRVLADRGSAAWRASEDKDPSVLKALDRDDDGFFAPRALHNIFFSAGPHDLNSYVRSVAWSASDGNPPENAPADVRLFPIAVLNYAAVLLSDHVIVPAVNDTPSVRLYADSPRIFIVSHIPRADNKGLEVYDLRRDRLLALSRSAESDSAAGDRKLWFAALEGALEHEAVARDATLLSGDAAAVVSTSSQLTADGVLTLRPTDAASVDSHTADAEKVHQLTASLKAGNTLIVPRSALGDGALAFWEISARGDARSVAGPDLNMATVYVSYNLPRSPPRANIVYDLSREGLKGSSQGSGSSAGTEYIGVVIMVVDLIGAVALTTCIVRQRMESARIELETDAIIADARRRQQAAGGS